MYTKVKTLSKTKPKQGAKQANDRKVITGKINKTGHTNRKKNGRIRMHNPFFAAFLPFVCLSGFWVFTTGFRNVLCTFGK